MKKKIGVVLAGLFCLAGCVVSGNLKKTVSADEIFTELNGVSVQKNYVISEKEGIDDSRSGVLLSAENSGSKVSLGNELCGDFSIDFRAFSEKSFSENVLRGNNINNSALDLKNLTFRFEEIDTGTTFDVKIDGASKSNFATPQASIVVGGKQVGRYSYFKTAKRSVTDENSGEVYLEATLARYDSSGNTTGANLDGQFTALYGTSFSNYAYIQRYSGTNYAVLKKSNTEIISVDSWDERTNAVASGISFNPKTMQVFGRSVVCGEIIDTLIWDLSLSEQDGQTATTLDSFQKYKVTMEFSDITQGKVANVVVYSISGQLLSGENYTNNIGPSLYAEFYENAIKNEKYYLPKPLACDVLGDTVSNIEISATLLGKDCPVYNKFGVKVDSYVEGCYIIPNRKGDLTVTYIGIDADFLAGDPFIQTITVLNSAPTVKFLLENEIEEGEIGKNSSIYLPKADVKSLLFRKNREAYVSVLKNGKALEAADRIIPGVYFTFNEVGEYDIEYSCEGTNITLDYHISVSDDIPAFILENEVKKTLLINEYYRIPKATVLCKGEEYPAGLYVKFPDGSVYSDYDLIPEEAGSYQVIYNTSLNGKVWSLKKYITVKQKSATFNTADSASTVTLGATDSRYAAIKGCKLVSADYKNVFVYNQKIDLSHSTKEDVLIQFYSSAPWGEAQSAVPKITLTDVNDTKNVLTITMHYGWHEYMQYLTASAPGQKEKGWNGNVLFDNLKWGTGVPYCVSAYVPTDVSYLQESVSLCYDAEERAIYAIAWGSTRMLVVDFDAEYQEIPWAGFSTGEVILSVSNVKNILITNVAGQTFEETDYIDTEAPKIFINTLDYSSQNLPAGVVGKPYKLFEAESIDNQDKNVRLSTRVFYDYGTDYYMESRVENGCFTPLFAGNYTVEYVAVDSFNNRTIRTVVITVKQENEIEKVAFDLEQLPPETGTVGVSFEIPGIINKQGGIGTLTEKIKIIFNGSETVLSGTNFKPLKPGRYGLIYEVKDYVGNGEPNEARKEFYINIEADRKPIIEKVTLPQVILSGAEIHLPEMQAVDYFTDPNGIIPETWISAKIDEREIPIVNNIIIPKIEAGKKILKISYNAKNSQGITSIEYDVVVLNIAHTAGFMAEYFQPIKGSVQTVAESGGIRLTANESYSTVAFVNPVLSQEFSIQVLTASQSPALNDITFTLFDSYDRNIYLTIQILKDVKNENNSLLSINGGSYRSIKGALSDPNIPFGFRYIEDSKAIVGLNGDIVGYVDALVDGKVFDGFSSKKVFVEISFGEINTNHVEVICAEINNQPFSTSSKDVIGPQCTIDGNVPLTIEEGSSLNVPRVIAQDVLSSQVSVSVSIKLKKQVLVQRDDNKEFSFTFDQIGTYILVFTVTDAAGKVSKPTFYISTVEYEAPTLILEGTIPTEIQLDKVYTLPAATAKDNVTQDPTIHIFIIDPDFEMVQIFDNKFTPEKAGTYIVRYYVTDQFNNYVLKDYVVKVI